MKQNKHIWIYISVVFLAMLILTTKFLGYSGRANLYPSYPLSWKEIYNNLPIYIIGSIVFTFVILKIYKYASEQQKRDTENAKKRIEEREKKEKDKNNSLHKI